MLRHAKRSISGTPAEVAIDHANYRAGTVLDSAVQGSLSLDLAE
jgi:hypothetical protein